ncbi:MAG: nuclear transport factor 2 family protein [Gammaproteobacteria bacterium]|nr:nuclear transport factor 2 family protein [Gammaproteobacteria bacterium]MCH9745088.1 nuclear transport factor 2 family protein [Gammaproteobacteria bacterium]
MDNKELIKGSFRDIFESESIDDAMVAKYFHPDYKQYVDGKELDYNQFIEHVKQLTSAVSSAKVEFQHLVAEGDSVCSVHIASGIKPDGRKVRAKVIAYFEIKEGLIVLCDELTYMLEGDEADRDLGSRH